MRKPALLILLFIFLAGVGFFGARLLDQRRLPVAPSIPVTTPESAPTAETPIPLTSAAIPALHGLIRVMDPSLFVDLRYNTPNNFTGQRIYPQAYLVMNQHTARILAAANVELQSLGYRLKIWDAYRPLSAQRMLWKKYPHGGFVADPRTGSMHNRGAAVDVTLVDAQGQEVLMPSAFDEFSPRAEIYYRQAPSEAIRNRDLLARVMCKHGFRRIKHEWWHFEDKQGTAWPLLDVPFSAFAGAKQQERD